MKVKVCNHKLNSIENATAGHFYKGDPFLLSAYVWHVTDFHLDHRYKTAEVKSAESPPAVPPSAVQGCSDGNANNQKLADMNLADSASADLLLADLYSAERLTVDFETADALSPSSRQYYLGDYDPVSSTKH